MQAIFRHGERTSIDHVAGETDIAVGDVIVLNELVGVADANIAAGALGSLSISGVFEVKKIAEDGIDPGETVYWDENGTPVVGAATSGAAASNPELGLVMGLAVDASVADDDPTVFVALNQHNTVPMDA